MNDCGPANTTERVTGDLTLGRYVADHRALATWKPLCGPDRLQALIDSLHEGLLLFNPQGRLLTWNRTALTLHDLTPDTPFPADLQALGRQFEVHDLQDRPLDLGQWPSSRLVGGETFSEVRVYVRNRHTGRRWVAQCSGQPVVAADGQVEALVITFRDITERHQSQEQLRELSVTLEQRVAERTAELEHHTSQLQALTLELSQAEDRERHRLAELLHDDLQQLLVGARFHQSILLRDLANQEPLAAVARLVDEVLCDCIQKSRNLSHELSPPALRRGGLVPGLQWLAEQTEHKHGLVVQVRGSTSAEPDTEAMRSFLFKAVREMLFNIVKHAGVQRARVRVRRGEGRLVLAVTDAGRGFDPASLRSAGGETGGLGLFSIQERVSRLGGEMRIRSTPGRGSRFTLWVPVRKQPRKATHPSSQHPRLRVLLVDDHRIVRQGLAAFLHNDAGVEIIGEAGSGAEAVELVRRLRPDVVLMDVSMPGMNGIEATRRIHARYPSVGIVGLSMHDEKDLAHEMLAAGAVEYLTKGGPAESLLAAIHRQAR